MRNKNIIQIPLFEGDIEVYTNKNKMLERLLELGLVRKVRKDKAKQLINTAYGVVYYETKTDLIILVYLPSHYDDVTVSHEIIHIITAFYKYYNLPAPKESRDEIFARYHDYLMTEIKKRIYGIQEKTE